MEVLLVIFIEVYKLFLYWLYNYCVIVIVEHHDFILVWRIEINALNFSAFWERSY